MIIEDYNVAPQSGMDDTAVSSRNPNSLNIVLYEKDIKAAEGVFYLHYHDRGTYLLSYSEEAISLFQDLGEKLNHIQSFTFYQPIAFVEPLMGFPDIQLAVHFKSLNLVVYTYDFDTHTLRPVLMLNGLTVKVPQPAITNFLSVPEFVGSSQGLIKRPFVMLLFFELSESHCIRGAEDRPA